MSHYFIANIKITDEEEYRKYLAQCDHVFSKYKGKYLAVDKNPTLMEGRWNYDRLVIIRFDSKKDFDEWYNSYEYQPILKHRLNGAVCDSILVKEIQ